MPDASPKASPEAGDDGRAYAAIVRSGTCLAALSGLAGASAIAAVTFGGVPSGLVGWALGLGGTLGTAAAMGGLWRVLVPRNRQFSVVLAAIAGLLAGLAGHLSAWIGFSFSMLVMAEPPSGTDLLRAFGVMPVMSVISVLLIGKFTLPLAVAVSSTVALFCRWQTRKLHLPA